MWERYAADSIRMREGLSLMLGRISKKDDENSEYLRACDSAEAFTILQRDSDAARATGGTRLGRPDSLVGVRPRFSPTELCQHTNVHVLEGIEFGHGNMFIDLVNAGAGRSSSTTCGQI